MARVPLSFGTNAQFISARGDLGNATSLNCNDVHYGGID